MRGEGLQLATVGAWVALAAVIVLGTTVLPKTRAWVGSTVGLQGTGLGSKLRRAERPADAALARKEPTGGLAASRHGRLPRGFPRCWEQGLRLAASARRCHWSPTKPACWRRRRIHRIISVRSRRVAHTRSDALPPQGRTYVAAHSDEARGVALKLFEQIRGADYEHFLRGEPGSGGAESRTAPAPDNDRRRPRAGRTSSRTFTGNPILSIEVGQVHIDGESRPRVPYRLTLSDGGVLAGDVTFEYVDLGEGAQWYPIDGIDWFLRGEGLQRDPRMAAGGIEDAGHPSLRVARGASRGAGPRSR